MSGISDIGFRRIAARFGAGHVVTEMVASEALIRREAEARLRLEGEGLSPHVVQLVGRDPAAMAEAARLAEASGADAIDINFGCPAKRVTGGLGGSALMREPETAAAIVSAIVGAVSVPVSVKMRLGWDDGSRNAAALAAECARRGAVAFAVHGRTRQQFYTGTADWAAIAAVATATDRPVAANGDVVDLPSARTCLERSGAAHVMIGRAALGQPWLVGAVAASLSGRRRAVPTPSERRDAACEHYETLLGVFGRAAGNRHARKHLAAYADVAAATGESGLDEVERRELVTGDDPGRVLALLGRIFVAGERRIAA